MILKPFSAASFEILPTSVLYQIVHEDPLASPEVRETLGPEAHALLTRCLAKSPGDRYPTAADLHAHLSSGQVELVVEHDHVADIELVEAHGFAHGAARLVHVGLGLEHQHALRSEAAPPTSSRHSSSARALSQECTVGKRAPALELRGQHTSRSSI